LSDKGIVRIKDSISRLDVLGVQVSAVNIPIAILDQPARGVLNSRTAHVKTILETATQTATNNAADKVNSGMSETYQLVPNEPVAKYPNAKVSVENRCS
jgi:hypothetical protein